jgi:hypothetical protein
MSATPRPFSISEAISLSRSVIVSLRFNRKNKSRSKPAFS